MSLSVFEIMKYVTRECSLIYLSEVLRKIAGHSVPDVSAVLDDLMIFSTVLMYNKVKKNVYVIR